MEKQSIPVSGGGGQNVSKLGSKEEKKFSYSPAHFKKAFTLAGGIMPQSTFTNSCKYGFTLAEVLITLGIIGIVAALTLPALVQKNQRKALETALKKNYSVLQFALQQASIEHGAPLTSYNVGRHEFKGLITKYLKVSKDCGWKDCIKVDANDYKTYNGNQLATTLFDDGQFILNDGSLFLIENPVENRIFISVDVNGMYKGPNRWGYDLFTFQLMDDGKLLPMGAENTFYNSGEVYCSTAPSNKNGENGLSCAYFALTDNDYWKNMP